MPALASDLQRMQAEFARALLHGQVGLLEEEIHAGQIGAAGRLQIYRNHLFHSLTEALKQTFATVERLVGEPFFAGLARAFIAEEPPKGPCLFEYGEGFAELIARHPACAGLPYLADVARFDFAVNRAWNAPDRIPIRLESLLALDPEELSEARLALSPSLTLIRSPYPLGAIWRANHRPRGEEEGVDLDQGGGRFMVWRLDEEVAWRELGAAEEAFIAALNDGQALSDSATLAAAEGELDLAKALALLAEGKVLTGFRT